MSGFGTDRIPVDALSELSQLRRDLDHFKAVALERMAASSRRLASGLLIAEPVIVTSNSTFVKADYPGLMAVIAEGVGGGGQGGGCDLTGAGVGSAGSGGGGGGYCWEFILVGALASSETLTIGQGGDSAGAAAAGEAGGDTTFGSHWTAGGGPGGNLGTATANVQSSPPTLGGVGTGGDLNESGGLGAWGRISAAVAGRGGHGGMSHFGGETMGGQTLNANGTNSNQRGGGGSGANNNASQGTGKAGGHGEDGLIFIIPIF